ncbi:hypothetical protein ACM66B_000590 [Microbotryomycetes sp. NB124-2]
MLRLPRPSASSTSAGARPEDLIDVTMSSSNGDQTPHASTSSAPTTAAGASSNSSTSRAPPRNFASQARQHAREQRGAMQKSPFIPKRRLSQTGSGKDRDLSGCSLEDLCDMLERNAVLLDSSETLARLPVGEAKLKAQRAKISARIQELQDLQQIKSKLDGTHIDPTSVSELDKVKTQKSDADEIMSGITTEAEPEATGANHADDPRQSPYAKKRIAARMQIPSPNSKMGAMSLGESIELQRAAVERERAEAELRQMQMELDTKRPTLVGGQLRGALKGHQQGALMSGYLFQGDDDDESEIDPDDLDHLIANFGSSVRDLAHDRGEHGRAEREPGELDDEEEATLNPYRTAYEAGWRQAVAEEDAGPAREIHP